MMAAFGLPSLHLTSAPTSSSHRPVESTSTIRTYHRPRIQWTTTLLLILACLVCQTLAITVTADKSSETLIIDERVPMLEDGEWVLISKQEHEMRELRKRADTTSSTTTSASIGTTTGTLTTFQITLSSLAEATTSTPKTTTTTKSATSSLPSPLDGSLASNFSESCSSFINTLLSDSTFKSCYPFSLLLQGSTSFFQAEKSLVSITQVLDATCTANVTSCSSFISNLATNLTSNANCGADFDKDNSVVVSTYVALIAYAPLYSAACLKDSSTNEYCYADAITNTTNVSDVYFYYLPLNVSLPGSTHPTCGSCLRNTMAIFQNAAQNRNQPVVNTYVSAAQQVNTICGPGFVNATLPAALVANGATLRGGGPASSLFAMAVALLAWTAVHFLL